MVYFHPLGVTLINIAYFESFRIGIKDTAYFYLMEEPFKWDNFAPFEEATSTRHMRPL